MLLGLIGGSTGTLFIRLAQREGVSSLTIAAARLTLGALVLTPFVLRGHWTEVRQLDRRDLGLAALAGVLIATHFMTLIVALQYTSILVNLVLTNSSPIWVALLEAYWLKSPPKQSMWFGLMLAFGGTVIIALSGANDSGLGHNPTLGIGLSALSSVAAAFYAILGRKVRAKVSFFPYVWLLFGSGAIVATCVALVSGTVTGTNMTTINPNGAVWLIMLTLCTQLMGHASYNYALGYFPATVVSLIGQAVIVTSAIIGYFAFNEIPQPLWLKTLGSAAIIAGVVWVTLAQPRPARLVSAESEALV
jgi:drug/metabolite transporter (DMT)-like permease